MNIHPAAQRDKKEIRTLRRRNTEATGTPIWRAIKTYTLSPGITTGMVFTIPNAEKKGKPSLLLKEVGPKPEDHRSSLSSED